MTDREALPQRRASETFTIEHWGDKFHVTTGFYPDGRPGEVFIAGSKSGVQLDAVCRDGAVLLSIAIQHGVPLDVMAGAITRDRDGAPSTVVGKILDRLAREAAP